MLHLRQDDRRYQARLGHTGSHDDHVRGAVVV